MSDEPYTPIVLRVIDSFYSDGSRDEWFLSRRLTDAEKAHIIELGTTDNYVDQIEQYLIDIDALNMDDEILIEVDVLLKTVEEY